MESGADFWLSRTTRALITTPRDPELRPRSASRLAARPRPKAPRLLPRARGRCKPPAFCVAAGTRATKLFPLIGVFDRMRPGRMLISSSREWQESDEVKFDEPVQRFVESERLRLECAACANMLTSNTKTTARESRRLSLLSCPPSVACAPSARSSHKGAKKCSNAPQNAKEVILHSPAWRAQR